MTIHYKKNEVRTKLFFGIVWFVLGIFWILNAQYNSTSTNGSNLIGFTWLILSVLYFINYFHQVKKQYLTIEKGVIRQNWLFGKEMKLQDIKKINNTDGKYLLQSEKQHMKINIQSIDDQSLIGLNEELIKLNVEWSNK